MAKEDYLLTDTKLVIISVSFVFNMMAVLMLFLLACRHVYCYYQDLFTKERKSVQHRRSPPKITTPYKLVSFFTTVVVVTGFLQSLSALQPVLPGYQGCRLGIFVAGAFWVSKLCTYYIFALRLHLVYDSSDWGIGKKRLIIASIGTSIYASVLATVYFRAWVVEPDPSKDAYNENGEDGDGFNVIYDRNSDISTVFNLCEQLDPLWFIFMYALFDVCLNLLYCYLFVRPIRSILLKMKDNESNLAPRSGGSNNVNNQRNLRLKMLAVGIKVAILSFVLLGSTCIAAAPFAFHITDIWSIDMMINATCLVVS